MPHLSIPRRSFLAGAGVVAAGLFGLAQSSMAPAVGKPTTTSRKPPKSTTTTLAATTTSEQATTTTTAGGNDGRYHDAYDRY